MPQVGETAPDFTLPGIVNGERRDYTLSEFRGRKVVLGTIGENDVLARAIKPTDWNQYTIIARGGVLIHILNGQVMSVMIDDHPTMFVDHGVLAIQLEGRGDNTAWFRNLWLKNLP